MTPMPCQKTYQALPAIDKLRGSENWASWKLLIMANARSLSLAAHIEGSAQSSLLLRGRDAYAKAELCARILILDSIAPELLVRLCDLGLQDNSSAADLMRWLHNTVITREPDSTVHDDLAKLMRLDRGDFASMDAYGKEALNLWARVKHCWPGSANVVAFTAILEGMKLYNEHAYQGWRQFMHMRKGKVLQQDVFDLVAALRDRIGVADDDDDDGDVEEEEAGPAGSESIYSQSSGKE